MNWILFKILSLLYIIRIRKSKREKKEQNKINKKIKQELPNFIPETEPNDIVVIRPRKSQPRKSQIKINKKSNIFFKVIYLIMNQ